MDTKHRAAVASLALLLGGLAAVGCGPVDNRKHLILYGDSLSVESGPYLGAAITKRGKVSFTNRAESGTAPCDWKGTIKKDIKNRIPEAAVIEAFGNNESSCQVGAGGLRPTMDSPAYWKMYKTDLLRTVRLFPRSTRVILVSAPAARNDLAHGSSHKARMLSTMEQIASRYGNVTAYDAGAKIEAPVGHFVRFMPCATPRPCPDHPKVGSAIVRALDGLHFCPPMVWAKLSLLKHCPIIAYGAWRFGLAEAVAAARQLRVVAVPPKLKKV